ncbi:glucokinase [Roseofilum casamattae]|uniref:Glucokinase n=1 Tax=Roseofilum casamattae BLCC-M143 TaxID=3022442 RepID=A0ABT7BQW7_9CYAN|nr:glucokinase [Roseofilum casamattae]MDJ1181590.1 glucokinase [Roseofilum casamattae BLCC-M143]
MSIRLAGDIGGTKTRLRLVQKQEDTDDLQVLAEERYPSQEFDDLVPIIKLFLQEKGRDFGYPEKACFAIAGPVANNEVKLTNLNWDLHGDRLQQQLNLQRVRLINDFSAIGYGILGLKAEDLNTLQVGIVNPNAPIAILGAGTGLGQGFVIPTGTGDYRVFASEGGHVDFAPRNDLEADLLPYLLAKYNWERVSVERIVCGSGITEIYQFLRDRNFAPESEFLAELYPQWLSEQQDENLEETIDLAAEISKAATAGGDPLSEQTMAMFMDAYGAEAGNVSLKFLPYGGLYIAGGIAAKNLSLMAKGQFLSAFRGKGRMTKLMQQIPVRIIVNQNVGLIGAAICADRL